MGTRCHYCGVGGHLTRDHIVPIARGGKDEPWNVVPACRPCNEAKAAGWPTCDCEFCTAAIAGHPRAFVAPLRDRSRTFRCYTSAERTREGPRCPDCGDITMSPDDCPWCQNVRANA